MANHKGPLGQSGQRLCELGMTMQAALRDDIVTPAEIVQLRHAACAVVAEAAAVEDVECDIELARQILHLGRDRAPDRHLRRRIASVERVRANTKPRSGCNLPRHGDRN